MLIDTYLYSIVLFWLFCAFEAIALKLAKPEDIPPLGTDVVTDYMAYELANDTWYQKVGAVFVSGLIPLVNTIFVYTALYCAVLRLWDGIKNLFNKKDK